MSVEWTAPAVVLEVRPHGEGGAVVSLLTEQHGRHAGLAKGGASRAQAGLWLPGNLIEARWIARLPDQLGALSGEMVHPAAALAMEDPLALALLSSACSIAADALPEREAHPRAFHALVSLIAHLAGGAETVLADYVRWEALVLGELGYGLNLDACAVTGVTEGLTHVSPRTGRAVSAGAAARLPARRRQRRRPRRLGCRAAPDRPFPGTRRLRRAAPTGARGAASAGGPGGGAGRAIGRAGPWRAAGVSPRHRERSTNHPCPMT
jgi:DNA repair protein RecO (recombination protein O)